MSLYGALNVAQSALAVTQAQIQVGGNNIANAGNANYTREVADINPAASQVLGPGIYVGTGVDLSGIQRQVDAALEQRINNGTSDNSAATTGSQWSGQIESMFNALGSNSLSSQLSTFFNDWSNLANSPQNAGLRQVVYQDGQTVAQTFNSLAGNLGTMGGDVGSQIQSQVQQASQLAQQVASLNGQILAGQSGASSGDNGLMDQRDAAINQLSQLVNVQTVQQGNGMVNVYVGSDPLVMGTASSGLAVSQQTANGQVQYGVVFQSNNATADVNSGQIGALIGAQDQINQVSTQLNTLAGGLVSSLNSLHSSGQGLEGFSQATATNQVLDPNVPLNDPATGLGDTPSNGSFVLQVTNSTTGLTSSTLVQVNLTGPPGGTTLSDLASQISAIPGMSASIAGGKLSLSTTSSDLTFSFSQDSGNALAALGLNTFYQGNSASNIAVNPAIANNLNLINAAQNGDVGDNQTALAISQLATAAQPSLGGNTLNSTYSNMISGVATTTANANNNVTSTQDVLDALTNQQQSVSGVSIDEETINLIKQQNAYMGAARIVTTLDAMFTALFDIT